jgi:hypothetical protein
VKSWKLNGIMIKGGKLDLRSGILYNENKRELKSELGMLTMEFGSFDRSYVDFIEGEPSVPLYVLPEKHRVANMEEDFFKQINQSIHHKEFSRSNLIADHLPTESNATGDKKSDGDTLPNLIQTQVSEPNGLLSVGRPKTPAVPTKTPGSTEKLSPNKDPENIRTGPHSHSNGEPNNCKGAHTIFNEGNDGAESVIHIVRIPLIFNAHSYVVPMNDLKFYIYCYSFYSQNYWIEKGTYASIEDIKGRFS